MAGRDAGPHHSLRKLASNIDHRLQERDDSRRPFLPFPSDLFLQKKKGANLYKEHICNPPRHHFEFYSARGWRPAGSLRPRPPRRQRPPPRQHKKRPRRHSEKPQPPPHERANTRAAHWVRSAPDSPVSSAVRVPPLLSFLFLSLSLSP